MIRKLTGHLLLRARYLACFCRAEAGATAVEFAIIGPAFIATLVAVLQVCIYLFAQMAIQNAAVEAGRYFMTGQAQTNGWTASTIVGMVCPTALFTCGNMYIVVQDYSTFAGASTSAPAMYNGSTPGIPRPVTLSTALARRRATSWWSSLFMRGRWSPGPWDSTLPICPTIKSN